MEVYSSWKVQTFCPGKPTKSEKYRQTLLFSFLLKHYNIAHLCSLLYRHLKNSYFWAKNTRSLDKRITLSPPNPPFFMTFASPINTLHSEHWTHLFCGCVMPEMCWTDLLFELLLMSLPFCSLIAHHLCTVPLTLRLWHIALNALK